MHTVKLYCLIISRIVLCLRIVSCFFDARVWISLFFAFFLTQKEISKLFLYKGVLKTIYIKTNQHNSKYLFKIIIKYQLYFWMFSSTNCFNDGSTICYLNKQTKNIRILKHKVLNIVYRPCHFYWKNHQVQVFVKLIPFSGLFFIHDSANSIKMDIIQYCHTLCSMYDQKQSTSIKQVPKRCFYIKWFNCILLMLFKLLVIYPFFPLIF